MKIVCIHRESREDRYKLFTEGVGKNLTYEFLCVDKAHQPVVENYAKMLGDLCCRASHAKAWLKAVSYQENVLIFEDDVECDQSVSMGELERVCSRFSGLDVGFFSWRNDTHAYVVTPESASVLLDLHLDIVCPVNLVQMSVDHRIRWSSNNGYVNSRVEDSYDFHQRGDRETSDNEWSNPEMLEVPIIYPTT